jgi:hypothetical protein
MRQRKAKVLLHLVVQRLAALANTLLASAQSAEILRGLGDDIVEQLFPIRTSMPQKWGKIHVRSGGLEMSRFIARTSKTMRPAGSSPMVISKNTLERDMRRLREQRAPRRQLRPGHFPVSEHGMKTLERRNKSVSRVSFSPASCVQTGNLVLSGSSVQ